MPRDASCGTENRFGSYLCGAGNSEKFGGSYRLYYTDQEAVVRAEAELRRMDEFYAGDSEARHVVMCDAMRPPSALGCGVDCAEKKDTVQSASRHGHRHRHVLDRQLDLPATVGHPL